MITIESAAELAAVSGGVAPLSNIACKVSISSNPLSCSGSAQDFLEVGFGAFDQLQSWGGQLGSWLYDVTHKK